MTGSRRSYHEKRDVALKKKNNKPAAKGRGVMLREERKGRRRRHSIHCSNENI